MSDLIKSTYADNILTIILNNPKKLNCITCEMLGLLDAEFTRAEEDDAVRVLVLRGAGDRSFSTGGDLKQFRTLQGKAVGQWIQKGNALFCKLENLAKPTIAAITGYALGGGLELALACDFRIATPNALFAMPELSHGWPPGWGGLTRLKQLIGEAHAKELILLGENINADKARHIGLVHDVVEKEKLPEKINSMTKKLADIRPDLFAFTKAALHDKSDRVSGAAISFDILTTYYTKLYNLNSEKE